MAGLEPLIEAIDKATDYLPGGWMVSIRIIRGSTWAVLEDPHGYDTPIESGVDLWEQINCAVKQARYETKCRFDSGWAGKCKETAETDGFCAKHYGKKCAGCGAEAIRECSQTGIQFVCGAPLCATCQHGVPEKGKEGWFLLGGGHVTQEIHEKQLEQRL